MKTFLRLVLSIGFLVALTGSRALACAACYSNNTGSRMGNAANWGVIAMAIIMFAMLGVIFAAGCYFNYRAKHPYPDYEELLSDDDVLPDPAP
jgi:hypothetical protein